MANVLQKIQKIHAELRPPTGAVAEGVSLHGKQLYRLQRKRSRAVPKVNPETGERAWRTHAITGEQLYPLNRPEVYTEDLLFYLESEGNANVRMVPYNPPTPEEIAEAERKGKIEDMKETVAAAFVDSGLTPDELIALLKRGQTTREPGPVATAEPEPAPEPEVAAEVEELDLSKFPIMVGPGVWDLSDGTRVTKMKKEEAEQAEQRAQAEAQARAQARADAAEVPGF